MAPPSQQNVSACSSISIVTCQSLTDGIKGSGLGLYFCRRIVEEHDGRIWIGDPAHGGSGTTVHVVLPEVLDYDAVNARH